MKVLKQIPRKFVLDALFPNRNVPEIEREAKSIPGGPHILSPSIRRQMIVAGSFVIGSS
jgi:hypothetical protein